MQAFLSAAFRISQRISQSGNRGQVTQQASSRATKKIWSLRQYSCAQNRQDRTRVLPTDLWEHVNNVTYEDGSNTSLEATYKLESSEAAFEWTRESLKTSIGALKVVLNILFVRIELPNMTIDMIVVTQFSNNNNNNNNHISDFNHFRSYSFVALLQAM